RRLLGDGIAIDPTEGVLLAPCDGEILTLPESRHAVSIRAQCGLELLVHLGIDTVKLAGHGFAARVKQGLCVKAGQELIRFDLDSVARGAKSLMTPIIVTSEGAVLARRRPPGRVSVGDVLFEAEPAPRATVASVNTDAGE